MPNVTETDVRNRLALSLDTDDLVAARRLARDVREYFGVVKVGLELFTAAGPEAVEVFVNDGFRVFLDLKLHDIPNTVAGAVAAARGLGVDLLFDRYELRAEGFDLALRGRADVVRPHHRSQPARGGDRLQPRHAGAEHHDGRGADRSGRGHRQGEVLLQQPRGLNDGPVPRHVRLARERVHRLGAGDARDEFHRERGRLAVGQGSHEVEVAMRREQPDQSRVGAKQARLIDGGRLDRADEVRSGPSPRGVADDLGSGVGVGLVPVTGLVPSARLHNHGHACVREALRRVRYRGYAPFARRGLAWHEQNGCRQWSLPVGTRARTGGIL